MLKNTETKETIVFFVTFLSLVAFRSGGKGGRAPWVPHRYAYVKGSGPLETISLMGAH